MAKASNVLDRAKEEASKYKNECRNADEFSRLQEAFEKLYLTEHELEQLEQILEHAEGVVAAEQPAFKPNIVSAMDWNADCKRKIEAVNRCIEACETAIRFSQEQLHGRIVQKESLLRIPCETENTITKDALDCRQNYQKARDNQQQLGKTVEQYCDIQGLIVELEEQAQESRDQLDELYAQVLDLKSVVEKKKADKKQLYEYMAKVRSYKIQREEAKRLAEETERCIDEERAAVRQLAEKAERRKEEERAAAAAQEKLKETERRLEEERAAAKRLAEEAERCLEEERAAAKRLAEKTTRRIEEARAALVAHLQVEEIERRFDEAQAAAITKRLAEDLRLEGERIAEDRRREEERVPEEDRRRLTEEQAAASCQTTARNCKSREDNKKHDEEVESHYDEDQLDSTFKKMTKVCGCQRKEAKRFLDKLRRCRDRRAIAKLLAEEAARRLEEERAEAKRLAEEAERRKEEEREAAVIKRLAEDLRLEGERFIEGRRREEERIAAATKQRLAEEDSRRRAEEQAAANCQTKARNRKICEENKNIADKVEWHFEDMIAPTFQDMDKACMKARKKEIKLFNRRLKEERAAAKRLAKEYKRRLKEERAAARLAEDARRREQEQATANRLGEETEDTSAADRLLWDF